MGRSIYWDYRDTFEDVYVISNRQNSKITKTKFAEDLDPSLVALGFVKNTNIFAQRKVKNIVANYNMESGDDVLLVNCDSASITIALLASVAWWNPTLDLTKLVTIKRIDSNAANTCTIVPFGGETIDGDPSLVLSGGSLPTVTMITDGSNIFTV